MSILMAASCCSLSLKKRTLTFSVRRKRNKALDLVSRDKSKKVVRFVNLKSDWDHKLVFIHQ